MRILIAHVYDGVDDELVWRALEKRVPEMIKQLVGDEGHSLHQGSPPQLTVAHDRPYPAIAPGSHGRAGAIAG